MFSKTYLFHFFSILLIFVSSIIYSQEYSEKNTKDVANSILNNFNSCVFTTLDSNNNPVSRLMDPYIYNNNFEIYLVTNPKSRKVSHLINNDRISLTFISKDSNSYVSINGSAVLINELSQKQKYWKSSWTPYYKDLDNDCILIKINIKSSRNICCCCRSMVNSAIKKIQTISDTFYLCPIFKFCISITSI